MNVNVEEIVQHPYRLTLELTESELTELQDTLGTVAILEKQFTESQRDQALEIGERISMIWRE